MGRYQDAIYSFGFLLSFHDLEKFGKEEKERKCPASEEKKSDGEGDCDEGDLSDDFGEDDGESENSIPELKAKGVVRSEGIDCRSATHILIHDSEFKIGCHVKGYPNPISLGAGIELMLGKIGEQLEKRQDFVDGAKFFKMKPRWHYVFSVGG